MVQIAIKYLVDPSQKDPTFGTRKMKKGFFMQRKWKLPLANLLAIQIYKHMQKWDHLDKLSFEISYNFGHLARNPWTFILKSPFWEDFFNRFALFQVCWFVWLLGHKLGCNAKVLHFYVFFELIKHRFQNAVKTGEGEHVRW